MPILQSKQDITIAVGTQTLPVTDQITLYNVRGTISVSGGQTAKIAPSGTPVAGLEYIFDYDANVTLANSATAILNFFDVLVIKGDGSGESTTLATTSWTGKFIYDGSAWDFQILPNTEDNAWIDTEDLGANVVTQAKMAADSVGMAELDSGEFTRGDLVYGDSSGDPGVLGVGTAHQFLGTDGNDVIWRTMSGDATLAAGVLTIANDAVDNNKLANITRGSIKVGGAANAPTDLAVGSAAQILVSDGTDPVWVSLSGAFTLDSTGEATLTNSFKLYDENVDSDLANTVSGNDAVAVGENNTVSGDNGAAIGIGNTVSAQAAGAMGSGNTASAIGAMSIGNSNTASGIFSLATGNESQASRRGEHAHANGNFATAGDSQVSRFVLSNQTTDASGTPLYLDGTTASTRLTLPSNSTLAFHIRVIGTQTGGAAGTEGDIHHFTAEGTINNIGGTTAIKGAVAVTTIDNDAAAAGWTVGVTADNTNDALIVTCTGEVNKNINWVAYVEAVQTIWP